MPRLANVMRLWKSPSPAKNIVVRRNKSPNRSPNRAVVTRNQSPNRKRKYGYNKQTAVKVLLWLIQAIALYYLYKYDQNLDKKEAARMGLHVISGFEKATKIFGKYDKEIVYLTSAIIKWVVYKLQQKGKFEIKFKEFIYEDIPTLIAGYSTARIGLSGIPLMKTQLEMYKSSKYGLGLVFGRGAAQEVQKILEYIIGYYMIVLGTLFSKNTLDFAFAELEYRGLVNSNGRLRLRLRGRNNRRSSTPLRLGQT